MLVFGEVGRTEQGVDGGARHPGQRGGGVDGDLAPRVAQAAALAPLLVLAPPLRLPLHAGQLSGGVLSLSLSRMLLSIVKCACHAAAPHLRTDPSRNPSAKQEPLAMLHALPFLPSATVAVCPCVHETGSRIHVS